MFKSPTSVGTYHRLQCISLFIYSAGYIRNYVTDGLSIQVISYDAISSKKYQFPHS